MDKRTRIILVVSLIANLFLVGAVVGGVIAGSKLMNRQEAARRGERGGLWVAFRAIPEERRDAIRRAMRADAEAARPELEAARAARRRAAQLIGAPTYDAAAVAAAMSEARESEARARARIDEALAGRLAGLSLEERKIFATVMDRGPRGARGRGDRQRPPPPPPEGPPPAP